MKKLAWTPQKATEKVLKNIKKNIYIFLYFFFTCVHTVNLLTRKIKNRHFIYFAAYFELF